MSRYNLYINDILRTIELIEKDTRSKSLKEFKSNKTLIDATAMRLQIIGESIKKLPSKFKKDKEVRWKELQELRNIISHAYFLINPIIIYETIKNKIPSLKQAILKIK